MPFNYRMPSQAVLSIITAHPGWVKPYGPVYDFDFVNGRYFGGNPSSLVTVSNSAAYAEYLSGLLVPTPANSLRISDKGLRTDPTATNVALWCRDLTNVAWTKTNVTAALDQVGVTGGANTASSLTATSGNGTVLQTVTLASSTRQQSAFVRRLTGTGNIDMTTDGGSTWTTLTVTSAWTRVVISQAAVTNPNLGFRIVTSGDAIAVDFVQNETTSFTSPILTTTVAVTRNFDSIVGIGALGDLLLRTSGLSFFFTTTFSSVNIIMGYASANRIMSASSLTIARITSNSVGTDATLGGSQNFNTTSHVKTASAFDATGNSVVGGYGTLGTSANVMATTSTCFIGGFGTSASTGIGYIERLTIWPRRLDDTTLKSLTF